MMIARRRRAPPPPGPPAGPLSLSELRELADLEEALAVCARLDRIRAEATVDVLRMKEAKQIDRAHRARARYASALGGGNE